MAFLRHRSWHEQTSNRSGSCQVQVWFMASTIGSRQEQIEWSIAGTTSHGHDAMFYMAWTNFVPGRNQKAVHGKDHVYRSMPCTKTHGPWYVQFNPCYGPNFIVRGRFKSNHYSTSHGPEHCTDSLRHRVQTQLRHWPTQYSDSP
jgi:hypothetical protein